MNKPITTYKAFNPDLTCRNFQFEVGKEYVIEDGDIKMCERGFHACSNPLDTLDYYPLISDDMKLTRFAEVEQSGTHETDSDKKICSSRIKIKAELTLANIIQIGIDFIFKSCKSRRTSASGDYSQLAASGDNSKLAASGDYSQLAASGYNSQLAASGDYSKLAASGDNSQLAASGYYSKLAASGYNSQLAASGDYSKLAASGDNSQLAASGDGSVVCGIGVDNIASAKKGSWITLAEWIDGRPKCVKTEYVDGIRIKEDTFYKLIDGEFKEV